MNNSELLFLPLGGVGEIGMNLALYGFGPKEERLWIMVDCGVTFPGPELPGVDLVLPDIRFCRRLGDALLGIVITHAHEDHYGALHALWPQLEKPVWVTPFTGAMIESKTNGNGRGLIDALKIYRAGDKFKIGPFEIEAMHVTHSIPEPVALAINTPLGQIVHTGDWKIDNAPSLGADSDAEAFRRIGKQGVLALVCDSTNAMRSGSSPTESAVSESLAKLIANARGRVAITTFSSNVGRIRSIALAAQKAGRKVLLIGRSIRRVVNVAADCGYMEGLEPFVDEDAFKSIDRRELVIILTGSQGEGRAALAKLARDEHPRVSFSPGDIVVYSSRTIPGNEKPINETRNLLVEQGVEVITDDLALVHVSGHPRRDELVKMYGWVKPEILVPVHGEAMHLMAHAALGAQSGIPAIAPVRNGDLLRLAPGPAEIVDQIDAGRLYKDGEIVGTEHGTGVGERRKLSFVGLVAVSVVIDRNGRLVDEVEIALHGLPQYAVSGEDFGDILLEAAYGAVQSIPPGRRKDREVVERAVEKAVRAEARAQWGRKPIVTVFVVRV
jgi:ribonuclease J